MMENIKINRNINADIVLTVKDVAELFCQMDGEQQAHFFNCVAKEVEKWNSPFVFQLQSILETEKLTTEANQIMREIGEYAYGHSVRQAKEVEDLFP